MKKLQLLSLVLMLVIWSNAGITQPSKHSPNQKTLTHLAKFSIRDYTTKTPIEHAVVTSQSGYELGSTNAEGYLAINLPHKSSEFYTIQAEGYNPMNLRLHDTDKKTAKYEVFLPSVEIGYDHLNSETSAIDTKPEMVKVYVKQDPATYQKKASQGGEILFSVQVSASSQPISQSSAQEQWKEIGQAFVQKENGLYKVRIGPYATQQEAKQILMAVKSKGRSDAFIVVQQNGEFDAPAIQQISKEMQTSAPEKMESEKIQPVHEQPTMQSGTAEYKVRVASYLHPGTFNPNEIDQLGPLESYRKGDWTIMMIGGFSTLDDAKRAKNIVVSKGFADAAVVVEKDGILETIQE
jgi:hypothetical protein